MAISRVFIAFCAALLGAVLTCLPAQAAATRISDFTLLDHRGKSHQLSWYGDQKAVVIFIQGNGCPIVRNGAPTLHAIRDAFEERGVTFFMLNPQPQDNRDSIAAEANEFGFELPILVDESQLIAEALGVDRTAETFIINPLTREILYRGPVDDRLGYETQKPQAKNHYLKDALDAVLAGNPVAGGTPEAPGCLVNFPARDKRSAQQVSYSEDVAPILEKHCVGCHHTGGIAPWSMTDHAMVQGWSKMMKEVLLTRRMPPGQIDTHLSKPVENDAEITAAELQTLVHWIDAGAPRGAGEDDPLTRLTFDNPRFTLGEPDIVLQVPPQTIPATGLIDYRYVPVELNLERDVWVRAVEFVPGDRQVLHHVIAYLSTPADKEVRGRRDSEGDQDSLAGYAPGRQPDTSRDNSGRLIRKGSNLLLQMHYTTSGKETVDATEIGLYLYDEPPKYVMSGEVAGQRRFLVPPHAKEYKLEGELLIERDAYLYSLMPHMHYRGKYMNYTAEYPDGTSEMLLSVPKYEFNWQFRYELEEPHFMPAGTRLVARGAMDNSERNPANPDPSVPVRFGLQTKH
ncbi:MAG: redoxin domain-containing protein, partial [Halioglobus sp.]|nr:redoxin domain-containing protein [Halioglobus sp.]